MNERSFILSGKQWRLSNAEFKSERWDIAWVAPHEVTNGAERAIIG
jgi:hypothetical protein